MQAKKDEKTDCKNIHGIPLDIRDGPSFPWRGIAFNIGRNFMSMDIMRAILNIMSASKMNVLHLIISDDIGFATRQNSSSYIIIIINISYDLECGQIYTQQSWNLT
jgi:hypothetical protein